MFALTKEAGLNKLVQGGLMYLMYLQYGFPDISILSIHILKRTNAGTTLDIYDWRHRPI